MPYNTIEYYWLIPDSPKCLNLQNSLNVKEQMDKHARSIASNWNARLGNSIPDKWGNIHLIVRGIAVGPPPVYPPGDGWTPFILITDFLRPVSPPRGNCGIVPASPLALAMHGRVKPSFEIRKRGWQVKLMRSLSRNAGGAVSMHRQPKRDHL